MSTDNAHSLSDSYNVQIGGSPKKLMTNLYGLEIDILRELETHWKDVYRYITSFLTSQGVEELTAKEIAILPGMELISGLFHIWRYYQTKEYDVVIIDTAPTADTLRLLSFPDAIEWYYTRFFGITRKVVKAARVTVGKVMKTPLPDDKVFTSFHEIYTRLKKVKELLTDPLITTVRLVLNPEKMVINETQRAFTYLSLYGFTVEALILNRVHPESLKGTYLHSMVDSQIENKKIIDECFPSVKIFEVPTYNFEIIGINALKVLADNLFSSDPTKIYSNHNPVKFFSEKGYNYVKIFLPFLETMDFNVYTKSDLLIIDIGNMRRVIHLPTGLINKQIISATYEKEYLTIKFEGEKYDTKEKKGKTEKRENNMQ